MVIRISGLIVGFSLFFSVSAFAGYAESSRIINAHDRVEATQKGQVMLAMIHRNAVKYLNGFANAHGGAVSPIQIRVNEGLTVSEFTTIDGYDCAMMATHNLILNCANPYTYKKITKVVPVL